MSPLDREADNEVYDLDCLDNEALYFVSKSKELVNEVFENGYPAVFESIVAPVTIMEFFHNDEWTQADDLAVNAFVACFEDRLEFFRDETSPTGLSFRFNII